MKLLVAVVIVLPLLAYAGSVGYVRLVGPHVRNNTLVGWNEPQIRDRYGQPVDNWQGYVSLGLSDSPALPPKGSIRTLIFHPRGLFHPEGGTLWVWLVERDGEWVCFESCWFADGVHF